MNSPLIVRESCVYRDNETPKIIESRIADTRKEALKIASLIGIIEHEVSEMYHPNSDNDLEAGRGWRVPATNWQEALAECIWSPYAKYTVVVREGADL